MEKYYFHVILQNTVILKREWAVPLTSPGELPHLKDKHRIFKFVENTNSKKLPDIQCILTDNIDGKKLYFIIFMSSRQ